MPRGYFEDDVIKRVVQSGGSFGNMDRSSWIYAIIFTVSFTWGELMKKHFVKCWL